MLSNQELLAHIPSAPTAFGSKKSPAAFAGGGAFVAVIAA
jgi:hypothetical protein